jgi:aspartate/glutamate racemase
LEVKKRIGCLHAHYSNIEYIEQAFTACDVELLHFVDPALVYRVSSDEAFSLSDARRKVMEQIEWIVQAGVDVILITCTNYIALLQEDQLSVAVPIIKIDEPFFDDIVNQELPQVLLFTNPDTVEGTMKRLNDYGHAIGKKPDVEAQVIDNTFELVMQGKKEQYLIVLSEYIRNLLVSNKNKAISVAQLSMVEAARDIQKESGVRIGNPLESLMDYIAENFVPDL